MTTTGGHKNRFHDLDALRAFAMSLGIILHGSLSFRLEPSAIAQDIDLGSPLFEPLNLIIHGVRMPLFFLLSGFFTMMLWEKSGHWGLLKQRSLRILVPFLVGMATLLPLLELIRQHGIEKKRRNLATHFGVGLKQSGSRVDSLISAACLGHHAAIEESLRTGVEVNQAAENGATALHSATFFGHAQTVDLLLSHGASIKVRNNKGMTAADILDSSWPAVRVVSEACPVEINKTAWRVGRELIQARFEFWNGTLVSLPTDLLAMTLDQNGWNVLHHAAFTGDLDKGSQVLAEGLDINSPTRKGNTALHLATLFGRERFVSLLLDSGADFRPTNELGESITDMLSHEWETVREYQPTFSESEWAAGKQGITDLFERRAQKASIPGLTLLKKRYYELSSNGQLAHLWFLNHLIWLTLGFIIATPVWHTIRHARWISWLTSFPICLLWLLPLTWEWQRQMPGMIGAGTSTGWLPSRAAFGYYAIFFAFGAISYRKDSLDKNLVKAWPLSLTAEGICLLIAIQLLDSPEPGMWFSLLACAYTWMAIFGLIGLFQRFIPREHTMTRYLSDASYWLYLSHLPLMVTIQSVISEWNYPAELKFLFSCTITISLLLLIYELGIRYTFIGTVLNGRRTRIPSTISDQSLKTFQP